MAPAEYSALSRLMRFPDAEPVMPSGRFEDQPGNCGLPGEFLRGLAENCNEGRVERGTFSTETGFVSESDQADQDFKARQEAEYQARRDTSQSAVREEMMSEELEKAKALLDKLAPVPAPTESVVLELFKDQTHRDEKLRRQLLKKIHNAECQRTGNFSAMIFSDDEDLL